MINELVLASRSPRRAELLHQLQVPFRIVCPDIDESIVKNEPAAEYVERMASSKYEQACASSREFSIAEQDLILCADTVVVLDQEILGKPINQKHGLEMLQKLSGRSHRVLTGVSIGRNIQRYTFFVETIVKFRRLNLDECEAYWLTEEPWDKAGAYGIQGIGSIFVSSIEGSYSNVVGLPLMETSEALLKFDVSIL